MSRRRYYAWRSRPESTRTQGNRILADRLRQFHAQTKERYGAVKLWQAVRVPSCGAVAVLHGLPARQVCLFRALVEHHQFTPPAPHRFQQGFVAPAANRTWAGDLTPTATRACRPYLGVILDPHLQRVIGRDMSVKPGPQVALRALQMALQQRGPAPGLIHHMDQGALYTSVAYRQLVDRAGLIASMSRKASCYDNAFVESF